MRTAPCKGCGKPIVFVAVLKEDGTSGRVPLDPRPPVYMVTVTEEPGGTPLSAIRIKDAMVSHFATCPKAAQFSGAKRTYSPMPTGEKSTPPQGGTGTVKS